MWDLVTPNLRAVAISAREPHVRLRFIFGNDPSDEDRENVSLVETNVFADFEDSVSVDVACVWLPAPSLRDLEPGEEWVYMRKEIVPAASMMSGYRLLLASAVGSRDGMALELDTESGEQLAEVFEDDAARTNGEVLYD